MPTSQNLEHLLNKTFYQIDVQAMLLGVVDFLEFSEARMVEQRERDVEIARRVGEDTKFEEKDEHLEDLYRVQLIENVEYRYDVSLTQRTRYAALVAFITAIDWCAYGLQRKLNFYLLPKPKGVNESIHVLDSLNEKGKCGYDIQISDIRNLIQVRNCVVHAAGLIDHYDYASQLRRTMSALQGFVISEENYLGKSVWIQAGALQEYIRSAHDWLPLLDERCTEQGLLRG